MKLPFLIALRYLFARKSHNVINIISAISVAGMAVGTAALILILSVYNGFESMIKENLSDLDPDVLIVPAQGKYFTPSDSLTGALHSDPRVASLCRVLEENVFLRYGNAEGIVRAKGVDAVYEEVSPLGRHCTAGEFTLHSGDIPKAAVGTSLAWKMGIRPQFLTQMQLFFPDREGRISPSNPSASLCSENISPSCLFSISADVDASLVVVPIQTMERLLRTDAASAESSALEVRLFDGNPGNVRKFIRDWSSPGGELLFLDRSAQHSTLFRMMRFEKTAIFLILFFVVAIIGFNVFGALSMLIMEKKDDIRILRAMGAGKKTTRRIFVLEGWMITLLGLAAGLLAGVGIALLQQKTGLVKMPGNFLISAYPVRIIWSDILIVAAGVALAGYLIALLPARRRDFED